MTTTAAPPPGTDLSRQHTVMAASFLIPSRREKPAARGALAVRDMRRTAITQLADWGLHSLTDDVTLIVSELTTNAILHSGGSEATVTMAIVDVRLRISVHDGMPGGPVKRPADDNSETGRGLLLVESLLHDHQGKWGTSDAGATVWCELDLPKATQ